MQAVALTHTGLRAGRGPAPVWGGQVRHVGIAAGFAVLLLATAACGPRVAPEGLAAAQETASPTGSAVETEPTQPDPAQDPGTPATPGHPGDPDATTEAPEPTASPDYGPKHNNGAVKIELSATCVKPGDLLVITFRTPPKAGLGMIIGYSDNQAHGAMLTGESDANGVYVWRVVVEPTVPDGDAKVLVTSTGPDWESEGGGTADAVFRVARGGC